MFTAILKLKSRHLAMYLFGPVVLAGILALAGKPLTGFLVFQLFIEGFVVWQVAIGWVLHAADERGVFYFFLFNMAVGVTYRTATNIHQFFEFLDKGHFSFLEVPVWWVVPIHLWATLGVVYCFYLNANWITAHEQVKSSPGPSRFATFLGLLIFPVGLWTIQPRLNKIVE